jgi:hypothetical protein
MNDGIDVGREVTATTEWLELDPPPVCPKNGKSMTNGRALPNGGGLTSGPGMVNGSALTSQTPRLDRERRPEGFHQYPEGVSRRWADHLPRGLGARRDLINGFSMEVERRAREEPRRRRFPWWRKDRQRERMEELAASPLPGGGSG